MLMYRYHSLPGARRKASGNGYPGAQFPWESAETGDEVTPTWVPHFSDPKKLVRIWTGDIQIHITADIAYAIMQYWRVTGDDAFLRDYGAEMILDGACFWGGRAEPEERDGQRRQSPGDTQPLADGAGVLAGRGQGVGDAGGVEGVEQAGHAR